MSDEPAIRPLRQLRRLSMPIMILLTVALALLVLASVCGAAAILFLFDGEGAWRAAASFETGVNLSILPSTDPVRGVALDALTFGERAIVALLGVACAACGGLAIFHLRQLFALYARGVVFAAENIRHIKRFGIWLVVAAIVTNGAGRLFILVTGEPAQDTANAVMALVYGGMSWAVARVMELGREADLERKEFV